MRLGRPILIATLIAGMLDILAAIAMTLIFGRRGIDEMLGYVASGPFPAAPSSGAGAVALGLAVHFTLMAIMAAAYVGAAVRMPALRRQPIRWGTIYGIATYAVMNLLVVPVRFTGMPALPSSWLGFGSQFAFHVVLVGIPIALIAAHHLRQPHER